MKMKFANFGLKLQYIIQNPAYSETRIASTLFHSVRNDGVVFKSDRPIR
jgi:hypothetical protein